MSGYLLNIIHCPDTRRVMKAALEAGWEWVGYTRSGHVEIRWPATGAVEHCSTTPSDRNSWKAFARSLKRASGVDVLPRSGKRRSRKTVQRTDFSLQVARRERDVFASQQDADRRAAEADRRRVEAARRRRVDEDLARTERLVAAERHRLEIEDLMQPGWRR